MSISHSTALIAAISISSYVLYYELGKKNNKKKSAISLTAPSKKSRFVGRHLRHGGNGDIAEAV